MPHEMTASWVMLMGLGAFHGINPGMGGAVVTPSNQELSHLTGPLEGSGQRYARGGVFGCDFERQVRLTLRWLAGVYGVHRPIPLRMGSVSCENFAGARERGK